MTRSLSAAAEAPTLRKDAELQPAAPENLRLEPVAVTPRRPRLLARVGRYALIGGGLCGFIGAVEGALVGFVFTPRQDFGALVLAVSCDRCLFFGLVGSVFGAALGALDWYLSSPE